MRKKCNVNQKTKLGKTVWFCLELTINVIILHSTHLLYSFASFMISSMHAWAWGIWLGRPTWNGSVDMRYKWNINGTEGLIQDINGGGCGGSSHGSFLCQDKSFLPPWCSSGRRESHSSGRGQAGQPRAVQTPQMQSPGKDFVSFGWKQTMTTQADSV